VSEPTRQWLGLVPSHGAPRKAPIGSVNPSGGSKVRKVGRADPCPVQSLRTPCWFPLWAGPKHLHLTGIQAPVISGQDAGSSGAGGDRMRRRVSLLLCLMVSISPAEGMPGGSQRAMFQWRRSPPRRSKRWCVCCGRGAGGDESDDDEAQLRVNEAKTKLKKARNEPRLRCLRVWTTRKDGHWCLARARPRRCRLTTKVDGCRIGA
jgi:hypothetical protein